MTPKTPLLWISASALALAAGPAVTQAQTRAETAAAAAIAHLENAGVEADLAGDQSFYRKVLAADWTRGDSDGNFYTKADMLKLMADKTSFQVNSEKISDLKVRVYGAAAVATYRSTYDILILGQRRAHTIIATDTFARVGGEWKQVASHGAEAK